MLQRSASGYQLDEVHASLDLLQQMLASNKVLNPLRFSIFSIVLSKYACFLDFAAGVFTFGHLSSM